MRRFITLFVVSSMALLFFPLSQAQAAVPTITSFTPDHGPVGTSVGISGTDFDTTTDVTFNSISATFTIDSPTHLTATVPADAATGPIGVTNADGPALSSTDFTVRALTPPSISGFSPHSGHPGTLVTITGTNFVGTTAVRFGGVLAATKTVVSATKITATVSGAGATGQITVTNPDGTAHTLSPFVLTYKPFIAAFSPHHGPVHSFVFLRGSHFDNVIKVTLGGKPALHTRLRAHGYGCGCLRGRPVA